MSRKLLAPLAVVMALALAACGEAPPADNSTTPPADAAPTTEPVTPPAS